MEEIKTDAGTQPQSCGLATWSLVLGIVGLVLCVLVIPSILAIIFGIVALVKINASQGLLTGKGKAIAGIVLGGLWPVMIPVLAIVAAIVIPNLLTGRISANEASAIGSLKVMTSTEALWLHEDTDGNGVRDYWTYDVSCLHRMLRSDGLTKCEFISIDLANADAAPADDNIFGNNRLAQRIGATTQPKSGYLFQVMELDQNGQSYNQEMVDGIPAGNKAKFAFVAYPAIYGSTGVNTFIVNQEGTVYANDCGSDANKIVLQWPGNNPAATTGPGGRQWRYAD